MAARGSFLDVGGVVVDFVQAIAAHEYGTLFDDQNVISLQEKCDALAAIGHVGRTEKLRRDGDGRRRRRRMRALRPEIFGRNLSLRFPRRGRRAEDENIAVRAGVIELLDFVQKIEAQVRLLNVERMKRRIRGEYSAQAWGLAALGIKGVRRDEQQTDEHVDLILSGHAQVLKYVCKSSCKRIPPAGVLA